MHSEDKDLHQDHLHGRTVGWEWKEHKIQTGVLNELVKPGYIGYVSFVYLSFLNADE